MILYLFNIVLVAMLAASTGYMVLINRRLRALRSGKDAIGPTIESFANVTAGMAETMRSLATDAQALVGDLEAAMTRAEKVRSDVNQLLGEMQAESKKLALRRAQLAFEERVQQRAAAAHREKAARMSEQAAAETSLAAGKVAAVPAPDEETETVSSTGTSEVRPEAKSYRYWVPRPASDEKLRAEALQVFYNDPKFA